MRRRALLALTATVVAATATTVTANPWEGTAATLPPSAPADVVITPAATVPAPTSLAFSPDGDTLYVASFTNQVWSLPVVGGMAAGPPSLFLGEVDPFSSSISAPLGVLATDLDNDGVDEVFVAASEPSRQNTGRTDGVVFRAQDLDGDGAAEQLQRAISGLPNGRHNTNGMALGPDGGLYIANGNATDSGINGEGGSGSAEVQPWSGSLLRIDADATDLECEWVFDDSWTVTDCPGVEVVGTGWRNIYDVDFAPDGHPVDDGSGLVAAVPMNGPDGQTYDGVTRPRGEDTLSILNATGPVEHFGFPWCLYDRANGGLGGFTQDPTNFGSCDPLPEAAYTGLPDGAVQAFPSALFGMHVSANGLAFNPNTSLPDAYDHDLFVTEWGNLFGDEPAGHKVVRVSFDAAGEVTGVHDFMTNVVPLDLTFGPDGALWVADMGGAIYRVTGILGI